MSFYNLYDATTYQSDPTDSISFNKFKEIQDYSLLDMMLFNSGAAFIFKTRYNLFFPDKPKIYSIRLSHLYVFRYFINTNIYPFDYLRFKNRYNPLKICRNEFFYGYFLGSFIGILEFLFFRTKAPDFTHLILNNEKTYNHGLISFIISRGFHAGLSWGLYFSLSSCLYHEISSELVFKKLGISFFSNLVAIMFSFPIYFISVHINYFKPSSHHKLKIKSIYRDLIFMYQKRDPSFQTGILFMIEHTILGALYLTWIDLFHYI